MRTCSFVAAVVAMATMTVLLVPASRARADVIRLNDGTSIRGDIKRAVDGWYVTDPSTGKVTHVSAEVVRSIELQPKGDPKEVAVGRLASLRRSVEALPDIKTVITRYEQFIEQNKDNAAIVAEAKKDLAQWREREGKGMVKVGGKWVTPEERTGMQEKALAVAEQARDMLKQNKLHDADATVAQALAADPTNVSALYLRGLILYRQDQIPAARKAFEAVKEAAPDHGPTLNNLAVILWRQNQQVAAINMYTQAMQAMPLNKDLLNNVAEALNALSDEQRRTPVAQKAIKLWTEQDNQLQQQLMPLGWYRWGATWVDKNQYDKLAAAEKEVKDKIGKLESDFAEAQQKVDAIDGQIRQNQDAMRYMQNNRVAYDSSGRAALYPLPPQYWDYDRANRRLEVQRQETVAQLDALRAKAQAVKQQLPLPKFTGVQVVIGVEGTPAVGPGEKPTQQATSAPPAAAVEAPANLTDAVGGGAGGAKGGGGKSPDAAKPAAGEGAATPKPAGGGGGGGDRPLKY
jgi:Flp pilus assembly protein TadD